MARYETFAHQRGWAGHRRKIAWSGVQAGRPYGASRQADLPATAGIESRRQRRLCAPPMQFPTRMFLPSRSQLLTTRHDLAWCRLTDDRSRGLEWANLKFRLSTQDLWG